MYSTPRYAVELDGETVCRCESSVLALMAVSKIAERGDFVTLTIMNVRAITRSREEVMV